MYNVSLIKIYQDGEILRRPEEKKSLKILAINNTNLQVELNTSNSTKQVKFLTFDELQKKMEECQKVNFTKFNLI